MTTEKFEFRTEVKQLLDLMIHSLYSHKEIFLRELISNASDAIDKARYVSLTNGVVLDEAGEWKILIAADKNEKTITVSDNGIGMTRDELVESLGTIAHSGTKQFLTALQSAESKDRPALIGQFGVGFYSAFMVAEKVTAHSEVIGAYLGHVRGTPPAKRYPPGIATGSITVVDVVATGAEKIRLVNHVPGER